MGGEAARAGEASGSRGSTWRVPGREVGAVKGAVKGPSPTSNCPLIAHVGAQELCSCMHAYGRLPASLQEDPEEVRALGSHVAWRL